MKNLKWATLVVMTLIFGAGIYAFQANEVVPEKVKQAFALKFPKVKKVKWDKESEIEWEAEFKLDGMGYSANFLENGTWKETEHELKRNQIPNKIQDIVAASFAGFEIEEAEISETDEGSNYEIEVEKGKEVYEVTMDMQGNILKKELKSNGEKDED